MKRFFKLIFLLFLFTSCVSKKELISKINISNVRDKIEIENFYLNKNLNTNSYQNLIKIINNQDKRKIFKSINQFSDSICVKIVYDGFKKLTVSYSDTFNTLKIYNLEVKNKGNYLSFKRKVKLIPIPFLFFYYWNEKSILYIDKENNLNIISGQNQFVWIILAGGVKYIYENKFQQIKNN